MNVESIWIKNTMSVLTNGRNHSVNVDLPVEKGGEDKGPTALELTFMSLAGCVTTIYSMLAKRHDFEFERLRCRFETQTEPDSTKIIQVNGVVEVESNNAEKAQRVWKQTRNACPVANILKAAGITINLEFKHTLLVIETPLHN